MSRLQTGAGFAWGVGITLAFIGVALLGFWWTPYDPTMLDILDKLQGPGRHHWFGTDQLGRDVLSMIMAGALNSVGVALLSVLVGLSVGVPAGLVAAARGGAADEVLMRGNDLIFAFPALLTAILVTAVAGPGAVNAVIAIGLFNIPVFARVTRGGALALWSREYILAARVAGKQWVRISFEHILPNLGRLLAVQATLQFSVAVTAEAAFSYLGLGAQPPTPSWGRMLNDAETLTARAPLLALYPGLAVALFVLGLNLLGNGMRPRQSA
jgi:peptide/nickel transport system permease protein